MPIPGSGPIVPGLTKSDAPSNGKDLIADVVSKMSGKAPAPRMSAGDKVAQAVQLLREAAQEDLRIAPLVNGAIQALVTGGGPGAPGQAPPGQIQGPTPQAAGGGQSGAMSQLASMMG